MPVFPSYITSLPVASKPLPLSIFSSSSMCSPAKAEPSTGDPLSAPAFPAMDSMNWPTVILDGNACGLIITSGTMPSAVYGMSSCGTTSPTTPFWPCLEANLSPISGTLMSLTRTLNIFPPSTFSVMKMESTTPASEGLTATEVSLL